MDLQLIMENAIKDIQLKQENLIKQKLKEYLGYDLDITEESKRRFPRLGIFSENGNTSYYWNDDTITGHRIITFYQEPIDFSDIDNNRLSVSISYK